MRLQPVRISDRFKSKAKGRFHRLATERLKEYMIKGFMMDDECLKNVGGGNCWKGFLERIRNIRFFEKAMQHHPMLMSDYVEHLNNVLKSTGEELLTDSGKVSHLQAMEKEKQNKGIIDCS